MTTHEMARPYFDRQMSRGDRAIFKWTPGTRWPADECANPGHPRGVCPTIHSMQAYYEGAHFVSEEAAARFDLERLCIGGCGDIVCEGQGWVSFDTWEAAEQWLRGERQTTLIHHTTVATQDGKHVMSRTGSIVA